MQLHSHVQLPNVVPDRHVDECKRGRCVAYLYNLAAPVKRPRRGTLDSKWCIHLLWLAVRWVCGRSASQRILV
jgi:hypothetical protein